MQVKTSELIDEPLDWAVAKCKPFGSGTYYESDEFLLNFHPSSDWAQGGPIIQREGISIECTYIPSNEWVAYMDGEHFEQSASTPLEAAMRCYVASKLGDVVDIPDELMEVTK